MECSSTLLFVEEKKSSAAIEGDSNTKTMTELSKKSLHFAPKIKVNLIPLVFDYSEEEKQSCWYTAIEIRTIKAECAATVRKVIEEQKHLNADTECFRGLEYRTPDGMRKRIWNKQTALDAVLDRQDILWKLDKTDEGKSIALAYRKYSVSCQEAAHQLGLEDERLIHSSSDWRQLKTNKERSLSRLSRRRVVETSANFEKSSPRRTLIGSSAA